MAPGQREGSIEAQEEIVPIRKKYFTRERIIILIRSKGEIAVR